MRPIVRIETVTHRFGMAPVLKGIDLDIAPASYTVLLGPSGSGKTTLLSILGGFLQPTEGRVLIDGEDCTRMAPARRPTATVFQDYALFPHLSVGRNVGFGPMLAGVPKAERDAQARRVLGLVGLEAAFDRKPHQLSGGQRQRVALARALAVRPKVLLLDEPLGALDLKLRRQMQDELKAIQREVGTAFVHVTHDQEEAMALADLCVLMNEGRIDDAGPPDRVYLRPRTRFGATFMGESTILEGVLKDSVLETALGRLPVAGEAAGGKAAVCLRPEDVRVAAEPGDLSLGTAKVESLVFQGSFRRLVARPDADPSLRVIVRAPRDAALAEGQAVRLHCRPDALRVLEG